MVCGYKCFHKALGTTFNLTHWYDVLSNAFRYKLSSIIINFRDDPSAALVRVAVSVSSPLWGSAHSIGSWAPIWRMDERGRRDRWSATRFSFLLKYTSWKSNCYGSSAHRANLPCFSSLVWRNRWSEEWSEKTVNWRHSKYWLHFLIPRYMASASIAFTE